MKNNHHHLKLRATVIAMVSLCTVTIVYAEVVPPEKSLAVKVPFDTAEAEKLLEPGPNTLKGRLETTFKKGLATETQHFYGARQQITLLPMTGYLRAWEQKFGKDPTTGVTFIDGYIVPYSARTVSDENGNFEFPGLKAGRYLILAEIPYKVDGYIREDTGKTQYNINWASSTVTESPIYDKRKAKLDLTHSIRQVIEVKEGGITLFKE